MYIGGKMNIGKVEELIIRNLVYINSDNNAIKAAVLMRENNISCLLVKEKGEFVVLEDDKIFWNNSYDKSWSVVF